MGLPKQVLDIKGKPLVVRILEIAQELKPEILTLVLGAHKESIYPHLKNYPINIVENPFWESGMASSIKMGVVGTYLVNKRVEKLIILTADMPGINAIHLEKLLEKSGEYEIVCSSYNGIIGVPACFARNTFEELISLKGDKGASVLFKNREVGKVMLLDSTDLDTKEDYYNYLNI